ncbi:hypothetical protein MVEN_01876200 [Mycena venus]|uniref:DUF6535 domain-containing protein n=1 Tax=Mycena venus TaxID=2733690 RepID=A0A8H7CKT1_9AGAR|nr:hypothetical protein MVEN_01876200 [Mycena venus]
MPREGKDRVYERASTASSDEAAAAKLWAVYVAEAQKYDKPLVEGWKSDMDGLLIFAGLFSAILTAFLSESYKSLNSDTGDQIVQLLAQISQQLAAPANQSSLQSTPSVVFRPSASSIVCNALWFISLGFSLACALIATLVQQWAREFLHKTDMRSAPIIRARIFSYLYYGLKRFQMHTVVHIIPLLLHTSLFFFFSGLVAFLIPVHIVMTVIAGAILFIVTVVYGIFTLAPIWYLDCPYRTPLSGAFWRGIRTSAGVWDRLRNLATRAAKDLETSPLRTTGNSGPTNDNTMGKAMVRTAIETRAERDQQTLVWTLKSLSDDIELEPFVEAIPDLLWGPVYRRHTYQDNILRLAHHPDAQLHRRIVTLLGSCEGGLLSVYHGEHRRIACYKALWAIGSLAELTYPSARWTFQVDVVLKSVASDAGTSPIDFTCIYPQFRLANSDPSAPYALSASAMMQWSTFAPCQTLSTSSHRAHLRRAGTRSQRTRRCILCSCFSEHSVVSSSATSASVLVRATRFFLFGLLFLFLRTWVFLARLGNASWWLLIAQGSFATVVSSRIFAPTGTRYLSLVPAT